MPQTPFDKYVYRSSLGYTLTIMAKNDARLEWRMVVYFHGMEFSQEVTTFTFDQRPNRRQMTKRVKEAWRAWLAKRHHDCINIDLVGSVEYDDE